MSKVSSSKIQRYSANPYIRTHSVHLLTGIKSLGKKVGNFYTNLFYSLQYEEQQLQKNLNNLLHLWTFKMPILVFIILVFSYLIFLNIFGLSIICSI